MRLQLPWTNAVELIVPLPGRHHICSIVFVRKGKTYLPDFVLTGWPKRESIGRSTICN